MKNTCCTPARAGDRPAPNPPIGQGKYPDAVVDIPGGRSLLGTDHPIIKVDGEGPIKKTNVAAFRIGATTVTNAAFEAFVDATGYVTEAEKWGWSFVFHAQVPAGNPATDGIVGAEWWRRVDGAKWNRLHGPHGAADIAPDHPVVHISWNDAQAYASWVGGRLPTEVEWEHAARGGLGNVRYPWGDQDPNDHDHFPCNIWQGQFPSHNTSGDGYETTAPGQSFEANGYGLYNMVGNVWQWTADPFKTRSLSKAAKAHAAQMKHHKVTKGGSFLCHASYCTRYRIAARTGNTPDSTTTHTGFRVVFDAC